MNAKNYFESVIQNMEAKDVEYFENIENHKKKKRSKNTHLIPKKKKRKK